MARRIPATLALTALLAACGGGGGGSAPDTRPEPFAFPARVDVAPSTPVESAPATITGIAAPARVTVRDGEYAVGCAGAWTREPGEVAPGGTLCVRHVSAAGAGASIATVLTVGGVGATFTSTTACGDGTWDGLAFTSLSGVATGTTVTSDAATVSGVCPPAGVPVGIAGAAGSLYSVNGGAFTAATGTVAEGDSVRVRHTSAATPGATVTTVLTIAGVASTFSSTTAETPAIALARAFPALDFDRPVALVQAPGDTSRWFVVEQSGTVRAFANDAAAATTTLVLDIAGLVGNATGERGLYSLAFDPGFATNRHAFVSYTRASPSLTSHVSRFTSTDGGATLDAGTEDVVLTLAQPFSNHNGGQAAFGPDGMLYVGFGDGGSANDPGDRAQDTRNLFGTIIRIDVDPLPYTIPAGNPFAGSPRCPAGSGTVACPEIHAWGFRNPWRFSFDRLTGELWAADVGQDAWEEVDLVTSGGNYGWRVREGAHCNIPSSGCATAGLTDPVAEYGHGLGQSVTGGFVYRGSAVPGLAGSYVFGDFVSGRVFRVAPGGDGAEVLLDTALSIVAFGEDAADGELFVVDYGGGIWRLGAAP